MLGPIARYFIFVTGLLFLGLSIWVLISSHSSATAEMPYLGIFFSLGAISMAVASAVDSRAKKVGFTTGARSEHTVTRSRICLALIAASLVLLASGFAAMLLLGDWWELHRGIPQGPMALIGLAGSGYYAVRLTAQSLKQDTSIVISPDGVTDHMTGRGIISWPEIADAKVERGNHIRLLLVDREPPRAFGVRLWQFFFGPKSNVMINLLGASAGIATLLPLIKSNIKNSTFAGGRP